MTTPVLATKLYIPPPRPQLVARPRLIARLNEGLHRKLTLISAPAGFGKTTLLADWLAQCERPVAWLSLDMGDNDPARFLTYLVAAVQRIAPAIGSGVAAALQSPQPPSLDAMLPALLNDLITLSDPCVLVLDDYHVIDSHPVDHALTFLLDHPPTQMHLVIATREDPALSLARPRAGGQLTELRAADLRFTPAEAAAFLNERMGLSLTADEVAALEARTEGWIAGLQLAAISLQGHPDATSFITSFTGSHHFVMDYLVEEVLHRQPIPIQTFLLRTSILDRLCGSLCEAVVGDPMAPGQTTLQYLEHANLFIVPLDDERRWYRYHHLFAELLRARLRQSLASSPGEAQSELNALHLRASHWYEAQGLSLEAFHHAAAAQDIDRAARLLESRGIPLHYHGTVMAILDWLASLPESELIARPSLLVRYAGLILVSGQTSGVEEKLQVAEAALSRAEEDDTTRDLMGQIATARATLALGQYQIEPMLAQSRCALEYLRPNNLPYRITAQWTLGFAHFLQGDRAAARRAYTDALALSQAPGGSIFTFMATIGLGAVQESENQLHFAAETYRHVLRLAGDMPPPIIYEAHLGLARICYQWNDLEAAERHGLQSHYLARQYEGRLDRVIVCEVFLAHLQLAQGDVAGAAAILAASGQSARRQNFVSRLPEIAAAQVLTFLRQGNLAAAAHLAERYNLPLSQARVDLAQGDPGAALAVLAPWRQHVEAKGWTDERLKVLVLQALALQAQGDIDRAVDVLGDALALAEPEGFIRTFVDEGAPMARLLAATAARGILPDYIGTLLAAWDAETEKREVTSRLSTASPAQPLIEPLSRREVEVLRLIAQGLSNQEISERLFLALSTVKGHNRTIFGKLRVQRRTEAVARARELGLL
jgi:LuxR family transcriptional regulator, maltose regulon positive regulatory protein